MMKLYTISQTILKVSASLLVVSGLVSCASTQTATGVETDGIYYNPSTDKTIAQAETEEQVNDGMIRIGGAYFDANGNGAEDMFYADATETSKAESSKPTNVYIHPGYTSQSISLEPTTDWGRYDGVNINVNYFGSSFYDPWYWGYGRGFYSWYRPWGWNPWYSPYYSIGWGWNSWGWNPWYSPYYAYGWGYPYYYGSYYGYGGWYNGWYNGYYYTPRYLQRATPGTRPGVMTSRNAVFDRNRSTLVRESNAVRNTTIRSNTDRNVRTNVRSTNANNPTNNTRVIREVQSNNTTRPVREVQGNDSRTMREVQTNDTRVVRPTVDRTQIRTNAPSTPNVRPSNNSRVNQNSNTQRSTPTRTNTRYSQPTRTNSSYSQPTRSSMSTGSMSSGAGRSSGISGGSRGTRR
ncbi:hypothetical protein [Vaginella massiliensis]|uniref:hypothetical protein n=1 Tax=Vaginella massiliensis TaxID=1816680 RepID=UPI0012B5F083|nr:hypothetical protein [Vaginella massiliensis]